MPHKPLHDKCTLWFCNEPYYGRGWCAKHYQNWLRSGSPIPRKAHDLRTALDMVDRLSALVAKQFGGNSGVYTKMDGTHLIGYQCKYCGRDSDEAFKIDHAEDCPIDEALHLLSHIQAPVPFIDDEKETDEDLE